MRAIVIGLMLAALVGAATRPWERSPSSGEAGAEPIVLVPGNATAEASPEERPAEAAAPPLAGGNANDARRASEGASVDAPAEPSVFYQWVDERGSVHFAAALDEVPADWRSRAGQIQLDSAAFNRTASPAANPVRPRPIVEVAPNRRSHDVTVYTAPWCGWCRKTLAFLDQRGVDYFNKHIEEDEDYADELREKTGGMAIPFVEIDGHAIRGFDPSQMTALLD